MLIQRTVEFLYAGFFFFKWKEKLEAVDAICFLCTNMHVHVVCCMPAVLFVNRMRTYGLGPLWSAQINWITANLSLNQVRQIAYQGVGRVSGVVG